MPGSLLKIYTIGCAMQTPDLDGYVFFCPSQADSSLVRAASRLLLSQPRRHSLTLVEQLQPSLPLVGAQLPQRHVCLDHDKHGFSPISLGDHSWDCHSLCMQ